MNPPEQAQALKEIFHARRELVRLNAVEIEDLELRMVRAKEKQRELTTQMHIAKANYDEASSKIVELLGDDDDDDGDEEDRKFSAHMNAHISRTSSTSSIENAVLLMQNEDDEEDAEDFDETNGDESDASTVVDFDNGEDSEDRKVPLKKISEVVDLIDSDESDEDNSDIRGLTGVSLKRETDEKEEICDGPTKKRSRSPQTSNGGQAQAIPSPAETRTPEQRDATTPPKDEALATPAASSSEKSSTDNRPRSLSTISTISSSSRGSRSGKMESKKRPKSAVFARRIGHRDRPHNVPPEVWLRSSIGRTREELNAIDDMVQYVGSCQFNQSVVYSKFGVVYAIVLNDELNELAQRTDQPQYWYVSLGPGRKRDARLVGASQSTIPLFHAPKIEYNTKELFYVGHYKVMNVEDLDPPIIQNEIERDMRVTFAFDRFDQKLDSIIRKGPQIDPTNTATFT